MNDDCWVHGDEIDLSYVAVQPHFGLVDHPAAIGLNQLQTAFKLFYLALLIGHQDVFLQCGNYLHS